MCGCGHALDDGNRPGHSGNDRALLEHLPPGATTRLVLIAHRAMNDAAGCRDEASGNNRRFTPRSSPSTRVLSPAPPS